MAGGEIGVAFGGEEEGIRMILIYKPTALNNLLEDGVFLHNNQVPKIVIAVQ